MGERRNVCVAQLGMGELSEKNVIRGLLYERISAIGFGAVRSGAEPGGNGAVPRHMRTPRC